MNEFFRQGGMIMYPLLVFSVLAVAVILERFIYFVGVRREIPDKTMNIAKENLKRGNIQDTVALFNHSNNPIHRILGKGVENWINGSQEMERVMEEMERVEFSKMERYLPMLHFIGKMSPSLGLLGTVTGMIKTFHFLSLNVESEQLAQGISEALITTAFGLVISICSFAAYYYFVNKTDHVIGHVEKRVLELIHYFQKLGQDYA